MLLRAVSADCSARERRLGRVANLKRSFAASIAASSSGALSRAARRVESLCVVALMRAERARRRRRGSGARRDASVGMGWAMRVGMGGLNGQIANGQMAKCVNGVSVRSRDRETGWEEQEGRESEEKSGPLPHPVAPLFVRAFLGCGGGKR